MTQTKEVELLPSSIVELLSPARNFFGAEKFTIDREFAEYIALIRKIILLIDRKNIILNFH
jgi:hypothetical protein